MDWEQDVFAFFHQVPEQQQRYGVIYPRWGGQLPLVIDLVRLEPLRVGTYNLATIQESYRKRIQLGVLGMAADLDEGDSTTKRLKDARGGIF